MSERNESDAVKQWRKDMMDKLPSMSAGWAKAKAKELGIPVTGRKNVMHERELQNECIKWLTKKGICFVRLAVNPSTFHENGRMIRIPSPMKGWPDVLTIVRGMAIGLEFKVDAPQDDDQKKVQKYIEEAGGKYFIVKSVERLEEIIKSFQT